jgi:POT family proton-dependent oligopeptide transporter
MATFVITLAELCISPVGLEFAYQQAAPGTKSIVTAAFWMMVFVGDSLGLTLAPFYENQLKPGAYFGVLAIVMTITGVAFVPISRKFRNDTPASETAS